MVVDSHQDEVVLTEKMIDQIDQGSRLPTLPSVAMEAIRLMEGEGASFESVAELLKNDQVLASRILQYANSAHVGSRRKVSTISEAISIVGFNAVRSIILSVSIFDCFSNKLAPLGKKLVNFWLHSIGVAATAEILASRLAFPSCDQAYVGGLIHDLGKLVCYLDSPDRFEELCRRLEQQGAFGMKAALPLDIEQEVIGATHIEAGRMLARRWGFPENLINVVWLHHQPVYETISPADENLYKLIRFADVLCVTHNIGASYFLLQNGYNHDHFHFALENLVLHHHLSPADIDSIMEEVHGRVEAVSTVLGIWDADEYRRLVGAANVSLGAMSMNLENQNRDLAEANRLLESVQAMIRQLQPGLSVRTAAGVIADAVRKTFHVGRCLCLLRDEAAREFVGLFFDGETHHETRVPINSAERKRHIEATQVSAIEAEAIRRLEAQSLNISEGAQVDAGVVSMVAGSQFLATFFVADRQSPLGGDPLLGELMVDFSNAAYGGEPEVQNRFAAFAAAAGNAVERLLLSGNLERQSREMADAMRRMEESQRQLFHSHRLATVGRLAAGAAHEINNPLTIISLNVQILNSMLGKKKESQEVRDRLKIIAEQEERISKIIHDLMGFARPSEPKFVQASAEQIMHKVLNVIEDRVSMANIEVVNDIPADLPWLMVDPLQIEQVFMNLLINATHAMPEGGKVFLSAQGRNGFVEVRIKDTGVGIPKKNLAKIFDPFFTTKKEGEGTGLGLAVCHSIVEQNGGRLLVTSEVGKGTTFTIILPVDKGSRLRALKSGIEQQQAAKKHVPLENCRILVIDDERILNDMLQDSLREAGFEVEGAYDGIEGIGRLRYKKFHLVLLDIRMPRKDGLEVLQFIKDEFPDVKVVIITGLASMEEVKETVRMGAHACLRKPFRLEKVLETVENAIQTICVPIKPE